MFERKNQKMEMYRKIVEQSIDAINGEASEDDFMTIKRIDHELTSSPGPSSTVDLSKRKLRMGQSKKAMLKYRGLGEKLIFDDEGQPHQVYEMKKGDEVPKKDVMKMGKEFAEKERSVMQNVDVIDKEVAKMRRKEKKRKRKEREQVSGEECIHNFHSHLVQGGVWCQCNRRDNRGR